MGVGLHNVKHIEKGQKSMKIKHQKHTETDYMGVGLHNVKHKEKGQKSMKIKTSNNTQKRITWVSDYMGIGLDR